MSALGELIGQFLAGLFGRKELAARGRGHVAARIAEFEAGDEPILSAALLSDGLWLEGRVRVARYRLVWWVPGSPGSLVFSRRDGVVESLGDVDGGNAETVDPNLVVLRYRSGGEVHHLAVPPEDLNLIGRVLPLPG